MHVGDWCSIRLKVARLHQSAAAAAHEERHCTAVEFLNSSRTNILSTVPMTEIEEDIFILQELFHLTLAGFSLNYSLPLIESSKYVFKSCLCLDKITTWVQNVSAKVCSREETNLSIYQI